MARQILERFSDGSVSRFNNALLAKIKPTRIDFDLLS